MNLDPKKNFIFYPLYWGSILCIPGEENKDLLRRAIIDYGITGEYDKSNPIVNAVMVNISKNIDSSESRYKKSQENGALGGRPKKVNYETLYREHAVYCKPIDKVASMYGVSKRTVQRAVAYERSLITPYEY